MPAPPVTGEIDQGSARMITVGDFMTRDLVTVKEDDDLALADSILRLGGIRHLPVVQGTRLVGLVTQRDLLRSAATRSHQTTRASEIMVREVVTARPDTSLVQAAKIMLANKFGCLPVVEPDGRLVGIITESDFVRFAADVVQDLDMVAEAVSAGNRA